MRRMFKMAVVLALVTQTGYGAGLYYEAVNRYEGGADQIGAWRVRAWVDGESAKVEFLESGNPMMPAGTYMVTSDGGKTLFLVQPTEKTYSRLDLDGMMEAAGQMLSNSGGMVKMEVSDPSVEMLADEPGEEILGRSTRYNRYKTTYEMRMKMLGMKRSSHTATDQEIWSIDLDDHAGLGVWLRKTPPSVGDTGIDKLIEAEMTKVQGFPVKSITRTTTTSGKKGRTDTSTVTLEVTELRNETIPDGTFAVDPTFTEVPMLMTGMGGDEEKQRGGLGGLLRKRRGDG